jgi:CUB/sushi domain-containing protein
MNMKVDEGTLLGATVHYTCERGHKLSGPTSGRCGVDGEWSKTESICEPVDCGNPGEIANGRVDVSNGTKLGARANYECDTGYTLNGKEYRVCGFDGDWKGRIPACAEVDCGHPGEIANGRVQIPNGTKFGAVIAYSCDVGYTRRGPSKRKCGQDGEWTKNSPTCKSEYSSTPFERPPLGTSKR